MYKNKKIAIGTLGCRLNKYESDSIETDFKNNGYNVVSINDIADVYIINTCTVTNKSDAKCRNLIRKVNNLNPNALLCVIGCYADTEPNLIKNINGVDYIIGNKKKSNVFNFIDNILKNDNYNLNYNSIEMLKDDVFDYSDATKGKHTRSFIKIQDGCNNRCTYCKIPDARGNPISRSFNNILNNIENLYDNGFREFILTGVNIIYYNYNGKTIEDLIEAIYNINGNFRLRLSSIEPDRISNKLIELISNEKMGKHLHIPLQSGSDKILESMGRKYNFKYYIELINKIRKKYNNINITTDLIVGFPNETDDDFNDSIYAIKECNFTHIHTFKYSKRNGTPAATMPNQVDESIKNERSKIIREISNKQNYNYKKQNQGKLFTILIEEIKKNDEYIYSQGFTENYIKIIIPKLKLEKGKFKLIKLIKVDKDNAIGELIENIIHH